ncbi:MAG: formate dehydrogenase subunit gamma [Gammaproteobacteria bacterium]
MRIRALVKVSPMLFLVILVAAFWLPGFLGSPIGASSADAKKFVNPIAEYWRKVREGRSGYSAVSGKESGVLIQGSGENWRRLRNGPVATLGAWFLAATLFGIGIFFAFRGKVRLSHPRSGERVPRWSAFERSLHWFTALLFLTLALTGLSLLYGRAILIPWFGHEAFADYAESAKTVHNFAGPLFIAGLLLMIIHWIKDNIPNRLDIDWFKAFGGLVGDRHPSAERMNGGEKVWFWLLVFAGLGVSVSGLLLDFPNLGTERLPLQLSHLAHSILAILLMVGALGHIYIGTIGTEGAFEGMITGKVDSSWAEQHHDLWLHEIKALRPGQEAEQDYN